MKHTWKSEAPSMPGGAAMRRRSPSRLAALAALLALGAGACSSTSAVLGKGGGPDSTGLVLVDCQFTFELVGDVRVYDQYLLTGMRHLESGQRAEIAWIHPVDDPAKEIPARPTRGLLLLGPLQPGAYVLDRVGLERRFLEASLRQGMEFVQEPAICRPGRAGTARIVFIVEPGRVTYLGMMQAKGFLASPEINPAFVPPGQDQATQPGLQRVRLIADDRSWTIDWDREVGHEIRAWENVLVALGGSAWRGPIDARLAFLREQAP